MYPLARTQNISSVGVRIPLPYIATMPTLGYEFLPVDRCCWFVLSFHFTFENAGAPMLPMDDGIATHHFNYPLMVLIAADTVALAPVVVEFLQKRYWLLVASKVMMSPLHSYFRPFIVSAALPSRFIPFYP